jgi:hypothetical protein
MSGESGTSALEFYMAELRHAVATGEGDLFAVASSVLTAYDAAEDAEPEPLTDAYQESVGTVASILLADHLETFEALRPLLTETAVEALAAAMEVCPVHVCDAAICADDRDDCPAGQGN